MGLIFSEVYRRLNSAYALSGFCMIVFMKFELEWLFSRSFSLFSVTVVGQPENPYSVATRSLVRIYHRPVQEIYEKSISLVMVEYFSQSEKSHSVICGVSFY